jgi:hypothetical protein
MENKTLKARNVVIHAKEIVNKMRETRAVKNSQALARLELKLNRANLKKEKQIQKKLEKLEQQQHTVHQE